jgi:hypothetical protein
MGSGAIAFSAAAEIKADRAALGVPFVARRCLAFSFLSSPGYAFDFSCG